MSDGTRDITTTLTGILPRIVRFRPSDKVNVTKEEIARLVRYGFVPVFTEYLPVIVAEQYAEDDNDE